MKQVSVEIIQQCPNQCVHCSSLSNMKCKEKILKDKVFEIVDGAVRLDTEVLSISGGEPFLHEDLYDIVKYSKMRGLKTNVYTSGVSVNQNGIVGALDFDLLSMLKDLGVDKIIFDLPAIEDDVYDAFMGTEGYLQYALKSIEDTKRLEIYTEIHFVPTQINVNQIDEVLLYAEKIGVDMVSFLGLVPHGRAEGKEDQLYLGEKENEKLKLKLNNFKRDNIRVGIPLQIHNDEYLCYAGREKLCIRYDGQVFGCEAFKYIELKDEHGKTVFPDSIYRRKIDDIYFNSEYLKLERKFAAKQLRKQGCCENCPIQQLFRKKAV